MINPTQIREAVDNRIMGVPSTLEQSVTKEGVRHDLFRGIDSGRCTVRLTDEDSGRVVGMKQFPSFEGAVYYFKLCTKPYSEIRKEEKGPSLGTITTHDMASSMVGM